MSLTDVIEINPRKLGGPPAFRGTRIPVYLLFDYLEAGQSIDEFTDASAAPASRPARLYRPT